MLHPNIQPIWLNFEVNGLDWLCCLAGSSKTAPRILIFSIAIGANYSYEMKNSEIWATCIFKHNNSFIATVLLVSVIKKWKRVPSSSIETSMCRCILVKLLFLCTANKNKTKWVPWATPLGPVCPL